MKRSLLSVVVAVLFSVGSLTGGAAGAAGQPNPVSPPNSIAFGKSLDQWMEAYWRWFLTGGEDGAKNVKFLPIACAAPVGCTISVSPGTALVLPLAGWVGWDPTDVLPDEWWGDRNHIYSETFLDGVPIAEPNAAYYVGPTPFDPAVPSPNYLFQSIGVVIKPLSPGAHQLNLRTEFKDFSVVFDNAWNINVVPPGRK